MDQKCINTFSTKILMMSSRIEALTSFDRPHKKNLHCWVSKQKGFNFIGSKIPLSKKILLGPKLVFLKVESRVLKLIKMKYLKEVKHFWKMSNASYQMLCCESEMFFCHFPKHQSLFSLVCPSLLWFNRKLFKYSWVSQHTNVNKNSVGIFGHFFGPFGLFFSALNLNLFSHFFEGQQIFL